MLGLERLLDFGLPIPRLLLLRGGRRRGDGRDRRQAVQHLPNVKFPHGPRRRRSRCPGLAAASLSRPRRPPRRRQTSPRRGGRCRGGPRSGAPRSSSSAGRAARRQSGSTGALLIGARGLGDGDWSQANRSRSAHQAPPPPVPRSPPAAAPRPARRGTRLAPGTAGPAPPAAGCSPLLPAEPPRPPHSPAKPSTAQQSTTQHRTAPSHRGSRGVTVRVRARVCVCRSPPAAAASPPAAAAAATAAAARPAARLSSAPSASSSELRVPPASHQRGFSRLLPAPAAARPHNHPPPPPPPLPAAEGASPASRSLPLA